MTADRLAVAEELLQLEEDGAQKHSVPAVAEILGVSESSVYRAIRKPAA